MLLGGVPCRAMTRNWSAICLRISGVKKPQEYEKKLKELNVSEEVKDTLKEALDGCAEKEISIRPGRTDEMLEKLTGSIMGAQVRDELCFAICFLFRKKLY